MKNFSGLSSKTTLVIFCFLNALISYADRTNISITIIPMSEKYNYSVIDQGLILSSFFYGYLSTQLLSGYLSLKFGGKKVLLVSCTMWSVFTFLIPFCSDFNVLILCRILLGFFEGFGFPAIMSLMKYIPPEDYSKSVSIVLAGSYSGAVLANLISPMIIKAFGWEWVFYIFAIFGVLWVFPWMMFEPQELMIFDPLVLDRRKLSDATINEDHIELSRSNSSLQPVDEERTYHINRSRSKSTNSNEAKEFSLNSIPWMKLFKSKQVWAIIIAQFCQSWTYWNLINWLPTYYKDTFHVDIMHIGFFTIVPYIIQGTSGLFVGYLTDYLLKRMRKLHVRRFMQISGMLGCSLFLIAATLASNIVEAMILISIGSGVYTMTFGGVAVNQLDIAPEYGSLVYAIGNTAGQLPGIVGVWLTGVMLNSTNNNWNLVFNLAGMISLFGSVCWYFMVGDEPIV